MLPIKLNNVEKGNYSENISAYISREMFKTLLINSEKIMVQLFSLNIPQNYVNLLFGQKHFHKIRLGWVSEGCLSV